MQSGPNRTEHSEGTGRVVSGVGGARRPGSRAAALVGPGQGPGRGSRDWRATTGPSLRGKVARKSWGTKSRGRGPASAAGGQVSPSSPEGDEGEACPPAKRPFRGRRRRGGDSAPAKVRSTAGAKRKAPGRPEPKASDGGAQGCHEHPRSRSKAPQATRRSRTRPV